MNLYNIVVGLGITTAAFVIVFIIYAGTTAKIIENYEKEVKELRKYKEALVKLSKNAPKK